MYITNFIYDNISLNDLGYVVCSFDKSSGGDISNGSNIEFTTVPVNYGTRHLLANSAYPECITATFQICKDPCVANYSPAMTVEEISRLASWLNRRDFHELRVNAPGYEHIFFVGSFKSISRYEFGGDTIGLTMEFVSNSPFALGDLVTETLEFHNASEQSPQQQTINFQTHVIGSRYPKVEVTCEAAGDLMLAFDYTGTGDLQDDMEVTVGDCSQNEVITFDYPMVTSSLRRDIMSGYFNLWYPRLCNRLSDNANIIYAGSPCTVRIMYNPEYKISL